MTASRNELRVGLVLLGLSGAAALGHQVLWTRRLADLVGASVESCARVLECFFLGIALGSAVAARVLPKLRRRWRAAGYTEMGVAILGLPVLLLPAWTGWIWPALGAEKLVEWQGPAIKLVLSVLVVVPPAFLMGMTLPLVTAAIGEPVEGPANRSTRLYAAYTLGGALGLALVVGLALHLVGAGGSLLLMIGVNLVAGIVCFRMAPDEPPATCPAPPPPVGRFAPPDARLYRLAPLLAVGSGIGIMAFEVLGLELLNLKLSLAFYTPAAVLAVVVLLLGCAAVVAPWLAHRCGGAERVLPMSLAAAGLMAAASPLIFLCLTAGQAAVALHGSGITRSLVRLAGVTFLSLGPAVISAGMVFPLLLCGGDPESSRWNGRRLGRLLAINGLGGIIGAEVARRLLLPGGGVHVALGVVGGFYAVLSVGVLVALGRSRVLQLAVPLAVAAGTGWLLSTVLRELPLFLRSATFRVVEVRSGGGRFPGGGRATGSWSGDVLG